MEILNETIQPNYVCAKCKKVFTPKRKLQGKRNPVCPECWKIEKPLVLKRQSLQEKKDRMFREGILMWKTWKILEDLKEKCVTRIKFSELLKRLELKHTAKKGELSSREIKNRKIVKEKAIKIGWDAVKKGNALFFELNTSA